MYYFNYDCIHCLLTFEHVNLTFYRNIKLITKSFHSISISISTLCIEKINYSDALQQLNGFIYRSDYLTSLKIKCTAIHTDKKEYENIWKYFTNLKKLYICIQCSFDDLRYYPISTNLTYLNLRCIHDTMLIEPNHPENILCLKLYNMTLKMSGNCFNRFTNLNSLTRDFLHDAKIGMTLMSKYNSKLTYLKLNNIDFVDLNRMTQLETKILSNIQLLEEK